MSLLIRKERTLYEGTSKLAELNFDTTSDSTRLVEANLEFIEYF